MDIIVLKGGDFMGTLAKVMKKNAVVLQKPSGTIAIRVDLDAIQRKFYDALLYIAKHELKENKEKKRFTIPLKDVKAILSKSDKIDKNNSYYIEKLKEVKKKDAEYNILDKDKGLKIKGWVSLVSDLQVTEDEKAKVVNITFELPERIKWALVDPNGVYANINLVIVRGLKSKYTIILYELAKDYEKVEIPEMTIDDFRKLFNIENKYKGRINNLKAKVLEPAVRELNENENVDFLVSYELKKTGKVYTHIKFYVNPKPAQLKFRQQAKKAFNDELKENKEAKELLALIPGKYREKMKVIGAILGGLKIKGKDYTKAQIEYVVKKFEAGKVKDFVVYLKKALEEDYAGAERVETDILTPEDAIGYSGYIYDENKKKISVRIGHVKKDENGDYLVRVDRADTGELYTWWKVDEDWLLERAKKKKEMENSF